MLHEDDTELDDTHLCIKCATTVVGIENYIKHRKANCCAGGSAGTAGKVSASTSSSTPQADGPDGPDGGTERPNAVSAGTTPPFDFEGEPIKEPERHKKVGPTFDYQNFELEADGHHQRVVDGGPNEYELGADMFFMSLELQSIIKQKTTGSSGGTAGTSGAAGPSASTGGTTAAVPKPPGPTRQPSKPPRKVLDFRPLAEHAQQQQQQQQQQQHQLPDDWLARPNESDKLMKAVSDISGHKKMELYPIFHQESPDPSDEDSEEEEYGAPPRTHTGGKWKPENRPSPNALHRHSAHWRDWTAPEHDKSLDTTLEEDELEAGQSFSPPPGHTRGKWVPGSKITRLEYKPVHEPLVRSYEDHLWCSICNRRLASRFVYERHLKSNRHLKRAQEESELERAVRPLYADELSKQVQQAQPGPSGSSRGTDDDDDDEDDVGGDAGDDDDDGEDNKSSMQDLSVAAVEEIVADQQQDPTGRVKRKRKCYYTKCGLCKTRLPVHLLGKHLISRYHYRRMLNAPAQCFNVVLRNMHRIVLESPFQCGPCKFYANCERHFMAHWNSTEHEQRVASSGGKFWCSFCKFECEGNFQMTEHLRGASHREAIAVINRSVPIIIRKITRIRCDCCEREFRYNAELRLHQRHCTEASPEAIEEVRTRVQNTFRCELCEATFPNRIRLLQHGQRLHRLPNYYCAICECSFGTAEESLRHRRTSRHKILSARLRKKPNQTRKTCTICREELADVLELKQHIVTCHPEVKYSCPRCGMCFVLAQELGRHVRDKNCTFFNSTAVASAALEAPSTSLPGPLMATDSPSATHQSRAASPGAAVPPDQPTLEAQSSPPSASSSSSSATRSHLPGPNSIISNDSIKVNMNDRKLGKKESQLYSGRAASSPGSTPAPARTPDQQHQEEEEEEEEDQQEDTADEPAKAAEDMMENYSPAAPPTAGSCGSLLPTYGIKLGSSAAPTISASSVSGHAPRLTPDSSTATVSGFPDCDHIVDGGEGGGGPGQASAEIFFALANNASENNTVYVDEIVGTIVGGEDGSGGVVCWQCKICPFSTSSQAEFLFHEILHSSKLDDKAKSSSASASSLPGSVPSDGADQARPTSSTTTSTAAKLTCPLCGRAFSKASLRCHLRQHTDERLFPCPLCPMAFTRKANLKNHTDNIHRRKVAEGERERDEGPTSGGNTGPTDPDNPGQRTQSPARSVCTTCGKTFANRYIMQQHSLVHLEKGSIKLFACQHEGCHYQARSAADARRHLPSHSDERNFACGEDGCDYRGKSLAQLRRHALRHEDLEKKYKCDRCPFATRIPGHLRRHQLVHSGRKPFACPHCDYSCNNIENLRKHVISTSKHKGKFLYECQLCQQEAADPVFGTNFQRDYRTHLEERHQLPPEKVMEVSKFF